MQFRWGIVGLGPLAHGGIAPAIMASARRRLVACANRSEARAREFAAAHGAHGVRIVRLTDALIRSLETGTAAAVDDD